MFVEWKETLVNLHSLQGFEPINKKFCEPAQKAISGCQGEREAFYRRSFREQGALGAGLQRSGEGRMKALRCSALLSQSLYLGSLAQSSRWVFSAWFLPLRVALGRGEKGHRGNSDPGLIFTFCQHRLWSLVAVGPRASPAPVALRSGGAPAFDVS